MGMKQRGKDDIWGGLYDFWLEEKPQIQDTDVLLNETDKINNIAGKWLITKESVVYKHILTHQRIQARFHHLEIEAKEKEQELFKNLRFFELSEITELPKPVLIDNYLNKHFF